MSHKALKSVCNRWVLKINLVGGLDQGAWSRLTVFWLPCLTTLSSCWAFMHQTQRGLYPWIEQHHAWLLPILAFTGGKPLFTHWVHGEYMVGSETKYPVWTKQVHFDYFLITFVIYPQFTHPNTHQVHVEYFQKVPSTEPTEGGSDLPTGFILINLHFAHNLLTQIPTRHILSIFTKYPAQQLVGIQVGTL